MPLEHDMAFYLPELLRQRLWMIWRNKRHELRKEICIMEVNQKEATEGESYEYASADLSVSCQA